MSDNFSKAGCSTPLHIASQNKQEEVAILLINQGADINIKDHLGKTPIFYAIQNGDLKMTQLLLSNGADIKGSPDLLNIAVSLKYREIIEVLLQHGTDINAKDDEGRTAIFFALKNVDLKMTQMLFSNGADIKDNPMLLNVAVVFNSREHIEFLLQHGVDINAKDDEGKTSIYYAIEYSDVEIVRLLLTNGANIKGSPELLNTAVKMKRREIVETLLQHGADINACDEEELTALHHITLIRHDNEDNGINNKVEIAKLLLSHGANVNATKTDGITPLHIAIIQNYKEMVEIYLKCGAKVNAVTDANVTPLHLAAIKGLLECVKILLQFGADIDSRDEDGHTALHLACQIHNLEVVEILLEYGSNINIVDNDNCTPLDPAMFTHTLFIYYNHAGICYCGEQSTDDVIINYLNQHILKIITASLYVSEKNLLLLDRKNNSSLRSSYEKEVEIMKVEKISDSNVSFYDFLTKNISQLAICARNEAIVEVLKSDGYKRKFPHYANMINNCFKKAMKRKELLEQVHKCLHFLFNTLPKLPYNCIEKIFSYLNNEDLKLLLDVFK